MMIAEWYYHLHLRMADSADGKDLPKA